MKLQEFVSETLKAIIAGVQEAQTYAESTGARVNPRLERDQNQTLKELHALGADGRLRRITDIDFDVAVTSTDTSETQAGAGIFVAALGVGVKDKSDTSNSCVSRIKFSVPMVLPVQGKT